MIPSPSSAPLATRVNAIILRESPFYMVTTPNHPGIQFNNIFSLASYHADVLFRPPTKNTAARRTTPYTSPWTAPPHPRGHPWTLPPLTPNQPFNVPQKPATMKISVTHLASTPYVNHQVTISPCQIGTPKMEFRHHLPKSPNENPPFLSWSPNLYSTINLHLSGTTAPHDEEYEKYRSHQP
jgi:hypothetical protein